MSHYPFGGGVVYSLPTGTWVPLAPSWVGGGVGVFPFFFLGSLFAVVSPLFQHATTAGCLEPEAAQFGCPKDGPYRPLFEESGGGESGFPEVPWGFLGIPPVGLRVACLPHVHSAFCGVGTFVQFAAGGSRPFEGGSNPCFQHG